ncbi:MAG: methyltransferase domain-containing protein [Candidatus Stygibacter frigidus]|nr:methyltransferase domain-containing protein [Candidatus Stygibacter frigidus]
MFSKKILKDKLPHPLKIILRHIRYCIYNKYDIELAFWRSRLKIDHGTFSNTLYQKLMLAMAEEPDDSFLEDKIIADFGCGPRGSLCWAKSARLRFGIDVLADRYAEEFRDNIVTHNMAYIKSTETVIPLPNNIIDVMFTLNAIDHVDNFPVICAEIIRIIKPGGLLIASFNLEESVSKAEPQILNEQIIKEQLLNFFKIVSYRITTKNSKNIYEPFFSGKLDYQTGQEGILWVKAVKK